MPVTAVLLALTELIHTYTGTSQICQKWITVFNIILAAIVVLFICKTEGNLFIMI